MQAKIYIKLKHGLLDVQGKTVKGGLDSLGFGNVHEVRVGKYIEIDLDHTDAAAAKADVEKMCEKLLSNPVIEDYRIDIEATATQS